MKSKLSFLALTLVGALFFSAQASAAVIASFATPSTGQVFNFDGDTSTISGDLTLLNGAMNIALLNNLSDTTTEDASFSLDAPIQFIGGAQQGANTLTFINDFNGDVLLEIEFSGANLSVAALSGTETPIFGATASIISITGAIVDSIAAPAVDGETFSFSFSNITASQNNATFAASFTASASPVPVPAALPLMFSGLLGGLLFGRKKAKA